MVVRKDKGLCPPGIQVVCSPCLRASVRSSDRQRCSFALAMGNPAFWAVIQTLSLRKLGFQAHWPTSRNLAVDVAESPSTKTESRALGSGL